MKKILLISNMYPSKEHPTYGVFIKNFEEEMSKQNFIFTKSVICGRGKNIFDKLLKYFYFFNNTISTAIKTEYDLIYTHYISHSLLPLLLIKNKINRPLVINAHGSDLLPTSIIGKTIQKLVIPIIKKADLIVVPSKYFQGIIHNKFNVPEHKIFISPSAGINTQLFQNKPKKNHNIFTIGYVSRIDPGKGWDTLIQAVNKLKQNTTLKFQVLIIGGGSQENELKTMVLENNLENIINIIGKVEHKKLPQWYNKMDLFIFPTTRQEESLGLVGLEAMSCGVPVIGSDIGGLKEYIQSGVNGELFSPGDANELTSKIFNFMQLSQSEKNRYSLEAVNTAKNYDSNIVSAHLSNRLLQLLSEHRLQDA